MVYSLQKYKVVKYNALPGVMAQDITSWAELKATVRELKKPEVQAVYHSLIIDTVKVCRI